MHSLRAFLRSYPAIGLLAVIAAVVMRIAVPSGFMPVFDHGKIVIRICSGTGPLTAAMDMQGTAHHMPGDANEHSKADQPCAFSGLSMPSLAATDPFLLAMVLVFVMATGLRPHLPPVLREAPFLRPPLRGPPTIG